MIPEDLGHAVGGQKSLRVHSADGEHTLPRPEAGTQSLDPLIGRKEIVIADDLNVSAVHPQQVEYRKPGEYQDNMHRPENPPSPEKDGKPGQAAQERHYQSA